MYHSGDDDDENDDSSVTSQGLPAFSDSHPKVQLYVTPPSRLSSNSSPCSPIDAPGEVCGPQVRITPPSRRQSTASSVLDPGYFSFPTSRRQSSVSPQQSDPDREFSGEIRLSVPRRSSRGSRHKVSSPCSPSYRSSSPSSEHSSQNIVNVPKPTPKQGFYTSSQPSIDLGFFSTPGSRRTSAVSPTTTSSRRQSSFSPPLILPTSPTRFRSYSPTHYYRPVSPTIKEAQKYSSSTSTTGSKKYPLPHNPLEKGYHSSPVSRRASYLYTAEYEFHSQPSSRRPSAVSPSRDLPSHSTPTSRRPSAYSPSMLEINPSYNTLRLSPSLFDESCLSPKPAFLSPSSAECGYYSTPVSRRPSAISPTTVKPQYFSSPSTRRQSFLPPSSLHIPVDHNSLRRPSAPAALCKQDYSKNKLLFSESPLSPDHRFQHYSVPDNELALSSISTQHAYKERVSRRPSINLQPSLIASNTAKHRQRRQSEPFVKEVSTSTFRHRTNSAHIPPVPRSPGRSRTGTRPRIKSLSSVTQEVVEMPLDNIREVSSTILQLSNYNC